MARAEGAPLICLMIFVWVALKFLLNMYRVDHHVSDLGWVDLDLVCSTTQLGQELVTIAAHQPGELPKSKSTQPRSET